MGPSFRIDATDCRQYRSGEQRGSRRFRSDSRSLHGSGQNLHHDHIDSHALSLRVVDAHSSSFDSLSIEHGDEVRTPALDVRARERKPERSFSWQNEFRQWIGDLEPTIPVYLFSAEDVVKKDRVQFLRRVTFTRSVHLSPLVSFSGTTVVEFSSWVTKCIVC